MDSVLSFFILAQMLHSSTWSSSNVRSCLLSYYKLQCLSTYFSLLALLSRSAYLPFITTLAASYLPTLTTKTAYHVMIFFNLFSAIAVPRGLLSSGHCQSSLSLPITIGCSWCEVYLRLQFVDGLCYEDPQHALEAFLGEISPARQHWQRDITVHV